MTCDTEYITPAPMLGTTQKPFPDTGEAFVFCMETTLERWLEMVGVLFDGIELLGLCPIGDYNIDLLRALERPVYQYPLGAVFPFVSNTLPDGFVLCDGTIYEQADYPEAFAALPELQVNGTQIQVPDMRNRVARGANGNLGAVGGADAVTLQPEQTPPHAHFYLVRDGTKVAKGTTIADPDFIFVAGESVIELPTGGTFNAEPVDIKPAHVALNHIIFLGT